MPFMQYIVTIREEFACLLVLIYIAWTYFAVDREKTYAHELFTYMLWVSIINVALDAVTIYTVNHRDTIPEWLNHGLHIIYIGTFPIFLWLVYLYVKSLAFKIHEHRITLRETLPVIVAFIAIAVLPMYYVESDFSDYSTGPADTVAYICAFVYFVLSVVLLIRYRKEMEPKERRGIALALGSLVSLVVAQAMVHQLLMTAVGITLINVALYYTVESPDSILIEKLAHEKERADAANEAKSSFLAHMSHEIRTPINSVLGMDEMILRESTEENILDYAENIRVSGGTLLSLINDILDFSKVEAGKMEIIPAQYELNSLINDLYNMVYTRAENKGLKLTIDIDRSVPNVLYGDEVRIKQCALNIITNAVKYTSEGSVKVSVTYDWLENGDILLRFTVKDTGIGMKPEALEKLFVPFARIEEKEHRNIEGTGLGMNITRQLLRLMGSDIEVKSKYGVGSEFSFGVRQGVVSNIPFGEGTLIFHGHHDSKDKKELFHAPHAKVLVVDDNEMNITVFFHLLKRTRIQVYAAASGKEALEMAGAKDYDLYFIDHMMPEMDGIETLKRLKEIPGRERSVCIALTANAVSGARESYLEAGFQDYLSKPIDHEKLERMLIRYLPDELIESADGNADKGADQNPQKTVKIDGLDTAAGIDNCGDEEAYKEILEVFYETIQERADDIERFYDGEKWEDYRIAVHGLKSSARTIGANELSDMAERLEKAAAEVEIETIKADNDRMLKLYKSYIEKLGLLIH
ncbi:MAG: response regulator [Lachnospiraceae bacterium]|nr:response regulator [Lachnospiraceae bacterium]